MPQIKFDQFSVIVPSEWENITNLAEGDELPPTIARREGVGALQFSIALYRDGRIPNPSIEDLLEMIVSFARLHHLGDTRDVITEKDPLMLAASSFRLEEDFLRPWQISDSRHFAFVTYRSQSELIERELAECEQIVRSLCFGQADRTPSLF